jgi:uncharacterized protein YceK
MKRGLISLALVVILLSGCGGYESGDCVQDVYLGYVWQAIERQPFSWDKYRARAWFEEDKTWGIPVYGVTLSRGAVVKVDCPFSLRVRRKPAAGQ